MTNQNFSGFFDDDNSNKEGSGDKPGNSLSGFFDAPKKAAPAKKSGDRYLTEERFRQLAREEGAEHILPTALSIFVQESGGGRTTATSIDGARSVMQVMPDTFKRMAKPGENIDNVEDNARAGLRYLKHISKYANTTDPARLAVGYFSGEGNVNKDPNGTPWRQDRKDGNGKTVSGYAADVVRRMGGKTQGAATPQQAQRKVMPLSQAPKWADIVAKPEYAKLTPEQKLETKQAYFDHFVAPHAGAQAAALRSEFLANTKNDEPSLFTRAKNTAGEIGGAVKNLIDHGTTGPASVLTGKTMPEQEVTANTSFAPVKPEVRAQFNAAWDAATPEARAKMQAAPGWQGQLARDRAGKDAIIDTRQDMTGGGVLNPVQQHSPLDTRAEARTAFISQRGEDPAFARRAAVEGAARGVPLGLEVDAVQKQYGTAQPSTFDFETANRFAPSAESNGFNNPIARGMAKGVSGLSKAVYGINEFVADTVGADEYAAWARGKADGLRGFEQAIGERGTYLERNLEGAINSITQQIPAMAMGIATGGTAAIPLGAMGVQSFGQEYSDGRAAGQSVGDAVQRAAAFAALEVLGEKFGLGDQIAAIKGAIKGMPSDQIMGFVMRAFAKEVPGEILTTSGQFAIDKIPGGVGLNPNAGVGDYFKQVADTIVQTVMQTGVMAGATTGLSTAVRYARNANKSDLSGLQPAAPALGDIGQPQPPQEPPAAPPAALAPEEAAAPAAPAPVDPIAQPDAVVESADAVVADLAQQAGVPLETVLPNRTPRRTAGEDSLLKMIEARRRQLTEKRDGTLETTFTDGGAQDSEKPGRALSPVEETELAAIEAKDMGTLRRMYGLDRQQAPEQMQAPEQAPLVPEQPAPTLADRSTEELEQQRRNAHAPEVRNAISQELQRRREAAKEQDATQPEQVPAQDQAPEGSQGPQEQQPAEPAAVVEPEAAPAAAAEPVAPKTEREASEQRRKTESRTGTDAGNAKPAGVNHADDFAIRPVEITEHLISTGNIKALYKAAGVKTADAFSDLPLEQRSKAYAKYVADGGKPAPTATEAYNDKVARQEREALIRRLQSDATVRQTNGKPFKTEASAKEFSTRHELDDTHEVAKVESGFVLKRLPEAWRPSVLKAMAERQANDPENQRQERAFARASKIGAAASDAVTSYENGDTSIEQFEAALDAAEKVGAGDTAANEAVTQAVAASKEDVEHLFGVDKKREKALERIKRGTAYFGSEKKAKEFITQNGLKDTHEVKQSEAGTRWDVVAKQSQEGGKQDATVKLANATAPEHVQTGVDDRELGQIVDDFNERQARMFEGGNAVTNVFQAPAKDEVVRLNDKARVYHKDHGWMTPAEAKARIAEWKEHVAAQYDDSAVRSANSQKVVLSLFDLSGEWSRPWEEAGYQVYRFDIQNDPEMGDVNNFSAEFFGDWFGDFDGMDIYAVLAACPCTDFAVSGARHFAAKDEDGRTVASVKLVHQTLNVIEYFKPAVWAIENPVGRIEKLGGLPPWRLSFDPNHLGDPYTKKTLIWGRFNADLPVAPVEPTEGSKMHRLYGGKSMATKNARSETPQGFSYGFFMANNAHDHPVMALANKYDRLDRGLIEKAIAAGVKQDDIERAIEDFYYMDLDDEAANGAIRDLIQKATPKTEKQAQEKREAANPRGMTQQPAKQDIDSMFDEVLAEEVAKDKAAEKPKTEKAAKELREHEPMFSQAAKLMEEQKAATGNTKAEAAVRRKVRALAKKVPQDHARTAAALDITATRLNMGTLQFAEQAQDEPKTEKAARARKQAAAPRAMTHEGLAADGKPIMPGDVFQTSSGRVTTPYPKQKSVKHATQWLIDNAVAEARARGDDFNVTSFSAETPGKGGFLPPATVESMQEYLFGQQPAVVRSILRPLVDPAQSAAEPPKTEREAKAQRTAAEAAKSAAKNTAAGLEAAINGLGELFGGSGKLNSGIAFDEQTYAKAKPLFEQAIAHMGEAGKDMKEAMRAVVRMVLDKFGPETANNMKPYVVRFIKDVAGQAGQEDNANTAPTQGERNESQVPDGAADQSAPDQSAAEVRADEGSGDAGPVPAKPAGADAGSDQRGAPGRDQQRSERGQPAVQSEPAGEDAGDQQRTKGGRGSGDSTSDGADRGAASRVGNDYRINPEELKRTGSWKTTAEQNVRIVELVKQLQKEGRRPTADEAALLTKFTGWGASEIANGIFPDRWGRFKPGWEELGQRLKAALTEEEYAQASRTTQYAHYTSPEVIGSIYDGLRRLGFGGGKVLEPGMGIGLFKGLMPSSVAAASQYTGVEYDSITGAIATLLYPESNIIVGDFTKTGMPRDFFDAAIGNPPFSSTVISNDPEYKKQGFMLHDYFFAKTIDRVKPGGLLVFVTSKGTMDKGTDRARKYLGERANLLGAIRLPQTAFKDNAGTEVVTDVIFLQKRGDGIPDNGVKWMGTAEVQTPQGPAQINEYFAAHPEMVLGTNALTGSMYRANEYTVIPEPGVNMDEAFAKAIENLPNGVFKPGAKNPAAAAAVAMERDFNPSHKKEGGLYVNDKGTLMQVDSGSGVELTHRRGADGKQIALKPADKAFLKSWVGLRDALKQAQLDQLTDGNWEKSLKALGKAYDAFVKQHGNLLAYSAIERTAEDGTVTVTKRFKNDPLLRLDVDGALAYSLEHIKENGEIVKAPVLTGRVLEKKRPPEIKTTQDALFVSLNDTGSLDLDHVAKLAGMDRDAVIEALGTAIYEAPGQGWQTADAYLSGNVVRKLKEAQAAARSDKRYQRNIDALLAVQPKPLGPTEITVKLGQNWIPAKDIEAFATESLGENIEVSYNARLGAWTVDQKGSNYTEFNTPKMDAGKILDSVLNNRQIKITWRDDEGKTHVDAEATEKANDVARKMREQFSRWIWTDTKRADRLVSYYNEHFNNIAPRQFDGSHLTLPGVSLHFNLYPHQKRAIWRMIQEGDTYLAHAVGAGKTFTMIAAGMEERRLGLSNKPMYVVPNHMLAQFAREFLELYPSANIMVADEQNFHTHNRRRFVAQAALNNPDAIIITHSAFGRIGMSDEFAGQFISDQIYEWKMALEETDKSDRITRKQIERRIEQLERRLEARQGKDKKDAVLAFEELGVDRLFVDEAHEFRKLDFATNQGNIKGIDPAGSQRAMDLFMKVTYLRGKKPGRALVAASGTPITNTMGELFTVQRLFQPDQLNEDGLDTFDAWANQYGDVVPGFEQNAAGGYEVVSRFAKFQNVPELMRRVRSFMDILTSSNLGELVQRPAVEQGGRQVVVTPEPDGYRAYQKQLETRINAIRNRKGPPKKGDDIILKVIADGRFSAIDMRFVDPSLPSDPKSKLNQAIDGLIEAYNATADHEYMTNGKPDPIKGASLILFTDIGLGEQSAESRGFDMKAWIEKRLTEAGIPREHIAFMRDHKEHAKKERLFADMREGKKRILIGGKDMETGVNVQKRLAYLAHLDAPWFPASVEQREGRIIRQGNQNKLVQVKAFATKSSYDSTMWGMNGRKARFIEQAMNGDYSVRSMEDVSEASAFEMASALASGDERYLKLAGLKSDIDRLERLRHAHHDDQNKLRRDKHWAETSIERDQKFVADLDEAMAKRVPIRAGDFAGKVGKAIYTNRDEFSSAIFNRTKELAAENFDGEQQIGEIGGFPITYYGITSKGSGSYGASVEVGIPGDPSPLLTVPLDPDTAVAGIATRAANQINSLDRMKAEATDRIATNKRRAEQIGQRLGAPFPEEADLMEKVAALNSLEAELTAEKAQADAPLDAPLDADDTDTTGKYNVEAPRAKYTDDKNLQLFLDYGPDESQSGPRGVAAQRKAVSGVDDLRSTENVLALALSRDYAARQRVNLVGQKVGSAEDLAILAQVYRDPRFETFRLVFVNDSGAVVSQIGLTSRLPASAVGIVGNDIGAYMKAISTTARNHGATGFYMLHNHPSGMAEASHADKRMTREFAMQLDRNGLDFKSHVVIDTNEYSTISRHGISEKFQKDFGQPAVYRNAEWENAKVVSPDALMTYAKRVQAERDAITLIHTDSQFNVKAISTIPVSAVSNKASARRNIIKASLKTQGSQVFAVSRNHDALMKIGAIVQDGVHIDEKGNVKSLRQEGLVLGGQPFPSERRARVTMDSSKEFAYLREWSSQQPAQKVAEPVADYSTRTPRSMMERAQRNMMHFFGNSQKLRTFGAYHKSLSTQYHKALKDKHFGKVFNLINAMQNHVSMAAIRPAELAPGVLPRVDDVRSAVRGMRGKGRVQMEKVSRAIFEGTLAGGGDQVMMGTVWSDDQLRERFDLDDAGIGLYRQARSAINTSIDELAAAEAYALAQNIVPKSVRENVIDNPKTAWNILRDEIQEQIDLLKKAMEAAVEGDDTERIASLFETLSYYEDTLAKVNDVFGLALDLKEAGYAPLMRFGQYTVTVFQIDPETGQTMRDEDGKAIVEYFGKFMTQAEAIAKQKAMEAEYPEEGGYRVTSGVESKTAHEMYAGVTPETVAMFGEMVGADEVTHRYYQNALTERSALKRRLQRKGTDGYSEELSRVLSNFITSNARLAAQRYYLRDVNNAIKYIPSEKGDVKDEASALKKFILDPSDAAAPVSTIMFAWYLGGSIAAAMVNMTQPLMMTFPYLSQFGGGQAAAEITKAIPYAMGKREIADSDLRDALKRASQEGIVDAQEIFHLYSMGAQSTSAALASALSRIPGAGKLVKEGGARARAGLDAFLTLWGSMFSLAERFNRKLTFIAAWNMAVANGTRDPYAFAVRAVNETQGIYNKVNRPNWARRSVGRTILTFKQFSIMYLEMMTRMWKHGGPEGKRATMMMLAILMLVSGEEGLPFVDDLDDLIDTIGQRLFGSDTNMKRFKRSAAHELLGKEMGDLLLYGISSKLPLDISGRLGLGNLIPGTGMLKPSDTTQRTREVAEVFGPAAGVVAQVGDAFDAMENNGVLGGAKAMAPKAVRDLAAGLEMASKGYSTDMMGRKVTDTTLLDAGLKSIGFNPTRVANVHRKSMPVQQDIGLQKKREAAIVDAWARAIIDGDDAKVNEAIAKLETWNTRNPNTPIVIKGTQIRGRVQTLLMEKEGRVLRTTPKEMRGLVADTLEDAE